MTTPMAMRGQDFSAGLSGDDIAQDMQPGQAGDVTNDVVHVQVHLQPRFLHTPHVVTDIAHELLAVSQISAQACYLRARVEAASQ